MKKALFLVCCLTVAAALAGCASTRVYTFSKERVDAEVAGNQGVIYGPVPAPHKVAVPDRDLIGVDIELATTDEIKNSVTAQPRPPVEDKDVSGNAGVVSDNGKTR